MSKSKFIKPMRLRQFYKILLMECSNIMAGNTIAISAHRENTNNEEPLIRPYTLKTRPALKAYRVRLTEYYAELERKSKLEKQARQQNLTDEEKALDDAAEENVSLADLEKQQEQNLAEFRKIYAKEKEELKLKKQQEAAGKPPVPEPEYSSCAIF